jgi:hypothetical protein
MMIFSTLGRSFLASLATLAFVSVASAGTVAFDFTGPGSQTGNLLSFTSGDLTLDVTASNYGTPVAIGDAFSAGPDLKVTRLQNYGLYVNYRGDNDHRIDGSYNEIVKFAFNKVVTLDWVTFGSIRNGSVFDLFAGPPLKFAGSQSVIGAAFGQSGSLFGVGASQDGYTTVCREVAVYNRRGRQTGTRQQCDCVYDYSAFKITGMQVSYSEVPLPAAGWLLMTGFGGLAALRRRKRA